MCFVSQNTFLYAACKLIHVFDISHQLLIIVEALRFQPVLQLGKTGARIKNRVIRKVVKQLHDKMLQQHLSVTSCMKCTLSWKGHNFLSVSYYNCDGNVVPCCMNSTISLASSSCPRQHLPSAFWQAFVYTSSLVSYCMYAW